MRLRTFFAVLLKITLPLGAAVATPLSAQPYFQDATEGSGLSFRHNSSKTSRKYLPETMSGGVAILDVDQDGWMDVFFVNGARLKYPQPTAEAPDKSDPRFWNRLYRNKQNGTFEDVTEKYGVAGRGYGMGAAVGDIDNDGYPDLLVTNAAVGEAPAVLLYRNDKGERFVEVAQSAGINARGWASSAAFLDFDNDGDLDLFVGRYMNWDYATDHRCGMETAHGRTYCHPDLFEPIPSYLFENQGDGTFRDVSEKSGIAAHPGKALGVAIADYNLDGWIDIAVANDSHPQYLFKNRGDGTFEEVGLTAGTAYDDDGQDFAGMGIAFDDLDDDSLPDLIATALPPQRYAVFYNLGEGIFDFQSATSNLGAISKLFSGWGMAVFDFDNDGAKDVFFANSHVMDNIAESQPHLGYLQRPLLLRHRVRRFVDVSDRGGRVFSQKWASRGAAVGDLDNDGDLDVMVSNLDGPPYFARNLASLHWIGFQLRGSTSNRDAVGARLILTRGDGSKAYATVTPAGSYLSSRDPRVFFGLGEKTDTVSLEVVWPGGGRQAIGSLQPDRLHAIAENQ